MKNNDGSPADLETAIQENNWPYAFKYVKQHIEELERRVKELENK